MCHVDGERGVNENLSNESAALSGSGASTK
jgi:hypothetical protein